MRASHVRQLLVAGLFAAASIAHADISPPPFPSGTNPQPMEAAQAEGIAMKREEVTLELFDAYAIVDATFIMNNTGKARTLEVGFPGENIPVRGARHSALVGFSAWVNGKKVLARDQLTESCEGGCKYGVPRRETWHVFSVPFSPGDTKVRVRYRVENDSPSPVGTGGSKCEVQKAAWYLLSTGRRWAGPIGEAVIRILPRRGVKPSSVVVLDASVQAPEGEAPSAALPAYAVRDASGITLRRQKLEPTEDDDLEILYCATLTQPKAGDRKP